MKFVILFPTFVLFIACNAMVGSFFFLYQKMYAQHFFCTFVALLLCWYIVKFFIQYHSTNRSDTKYLHWLAQRQLTTGSRKSGDSQTYWPDQPTPDERLNDLRGFIDFCQRLAEYQKQSPEYQQFTPTNEVKHALCFCGAFGPDIVCPYGGGCYRTSRG